MTFPYSVPALRFLSCYEYTHPTQKRCLLQSIQRNDASRFPHANNYTLCKFLSLFAKSPGATGVSDPRLASPTRTARCDNVLGRHVRLSCERDIHKVPTDSLLCCAGLRFLLTVSRMAYWGGMGICYHLFNNREHPWDNHNFTTKYWSRFRSSSIVAIIGPSLLAATIFAFYSPKVLGLRLKGLFWGWCLILGIAYYCLVLKNPSWFSNHAALVVKITCEKNWNCNNPCGNITTMDVLSRSSMTDSLQPIFFNIRDVENAQRRNSNKAWSVKKSGDWIKDLNIATPEYVFGAANYGTAFTTGFPIAMLFLPMLLHVWLRHRHTRNMAFRWIVCELIVPEPAQLGSRLFTLIARFTAYAWYIMCFLLPPLLLIYYSIRILIEYVKKNGQIERMFCRRARTNITKPARNLTKFVACAWYFWGLPAYLLFPLAAIYSAFYFDRGLKLYPEGESPQAIGQWATWVGVTLTLIFIFITRLNASKKLKSKPTYLDDTKYRLR